MWTSVSGFQRFFAHVQLTGCGVFCYISLPVYQLVTLWWRALRDSWAAFDVERPFPIQDEERAREAVAATHRDERGGGPSIDSRPRDATTTTWMRGPRVGRHVRTCSRHCGSRASAELKADADGGVDARAIASSTESIHGSAVAASAVARLILIRCSVNVMARPWALALAFSASRGRQGTGENDGSCSEGLFRCSQTAKTFEEMSTFWKNGSKQGLVNLAVKI